MIQRIAGGLAPLRGDKHSRAVSFIKDVTKGFDPEHMGYLVMRQIPLSRLVPSKLEGPLTAWLLTNMDLQNLAPEEWLQCALEARPDCAESLNTSIGKRWLKTLLEQ